MGKELEVNKTKQVWFPILVASQIALAGTAWAIAPRYVSDHELASSPVIVIAKWNRTARTPHLRYREEGSEKVVTGMEVFTDLEILRVIKGEVEPGTTRVKVNWGVSWNESGGEVNSGTSTEMPGDVKDVTEPNIWFLNHEGSWDEKDHTDYLTVGHYRAIQPLKLEEYYKALASEHPETEVPKLLAKNDTEVVARTLRYVCGGTSPEIRLQAFAFLDRDREPAQPWRMLTTQADAVKSVVEGAREAKLRGTALVAYWKMGGTEKAAVARKCLEDEAPYVRATAIVLLAGAKDAAAIPTINKAAGGIRDPYEACCVIESLNNWADARVVPALRNFLTIQKSAARLGDDEFVPALKAEQALEKITGAKPSPVPLKATMVGDGPEKMRIAVINISDKDVTLPKAPEWIGMDWDSGSGGAAPTERSEDAIVTLKPGERIEIPITINNESKNSFFRAEISKRKVTVSYRKQSWTREETARSKANVWRGSLVADFGKEWREERKGEMIEETWPNGNLKAKGKTVNGQRIGQWEFFNEAGDRIRTIGYSGGSGSAECNPEHPDNKGAGKRKKQTK